MSQRYYDILGVSKKATITEIKDAYERLCKEYEPSDHQFDPEYVKRYEEVQEAFDWLKNNHMWTINVEEESNDETAPPQQPDKQEKLIDLRYVLLAVVILSSAICYLFVSPYLGSGSSQNVVVSNNQSGNTNQRETVNLAKLYVFLFREEYTARTFEEFKAKFKESEYRDKLYQVVFRDGHYTKSRKEFENKYFHSFPSYTSESIMFELEDLYDFTIEGAFANKEEFIEFAKNTPKEEMHLLFRDGVFADNEEFLKSVNLPSSETEMTPEVTSGMNEEYLWKIFEAINGVQKGFDFNAFKHDMSTKPDYNRKVFDAIGGEAAGFDYQAFSFDTGLEKKEQLTEDNLKMLYESAVTKFDMPEYNQFKLDMQDEEKLSKFRKSMSQHFTMPDLNTLKKDIGFSKADVIKSPNTTTSLSHGGNPYGYCYTSSKSCSSSCSEIKVSASSRVGTIVIIKQKEEVVRCAYIDKGRTFTFKLPNGTYTPYFYSGTGWSNKKYMKTTTQCGRLYGGFTVGESVGKDTPQTLNNQILSYDLNTQYDGNFQTKSSDVSEAF